jgi:hypothetical protein
VRETALVEAAHPGEDVPPNGPQPCPERRRGAATPLMYVVVQEVPEVGHDAAVTWVVVIRAEYSGKCRIFGVSRPDSGEDVCVHLNIGVDEDDYVTAGAPHACVPRSGGTEARRPVDDDDFLWRVCGPLDRGADASKRRRLVCRRDDRAEREPARAGALCGVADRANLSFRRVAA